jgi:hypothetical protein
MQKQNDGPDGHQGSRGQAARRRRRGGGASQRKSTTAAATPRLSAPTHGPRVQAATRVTPRNTRTRHTKARAGDLIQHQGAHQRRAGGHRDRAPGTLAGRHPRPSTGSVTCPSPCHRRRAPRTQLALRDLVAHDRGVVPAPCVRRPEATPATAPAPGGRPGPRGSVAAPVAPEGACADQEPLAQVRQRHRVFTLDRPGRRSCRSWASARARVARARVIAASLFSTRRYADRCAVWLASSRRAVRATRAVAVAMTRACSLRFMVLWSPACASTSRRSRSGRPERCRSRTPTTRQSSSLAAGDRGRDAGDEGPDHEEPKDDPHQSASLPIPPQRNPCHALRSARRHACTAGAR